MAGSDTDSAAQKNLWQRLWARPKKWYWLGIPSGGYALFLVGIIFWGGLNTAVEYSNSEAFCISCHEMRDNVYEEYQTTIHYNNRTGVRAVCADCHVPKKWTAKMTRKMRASIHELPHWMLGTIDTREKFDARRLFLANRVWTDMKASNSQECRNCHELAHMDLEMQQRSARSKHTEERAQERGETCIDCHQGIAHTLADGWEDEFDSL
ncbi:MAG: NapC/NirT family cytochrome c [Gammaproteobacteria bacterium]|nr:NapC/NirT family cytochrome c [Gammaproteobacteria bacterium]MDH5303742.1 NapC/NirT family cytochrome c [Gammaproteobacteria bacterium]MDH5322272.1 NapC/NirT family cytochrome c [Gammaproteobacteria bacterium]